MSSLNNRCSKPDIKVEVMAKVDMSAITSTTIISPNRTNNSNSEYSAKNGKKKRLIPRIFGSKRNGRGSSDEDSLKSDGDNGFDLDLDQKILSRRNELMETAPFRRKTFSERSGTSSNIESLNLSNFEQSPANEIKEIRIFVATWNVGGRAPNNGLNLEDFLQIEGVSDIYIIGFQEIVPLSAGNVLGSEDNEPAAKWLLLIDQALNKPHHESAYSSGNIGSKISNNSKDSKYSKDSKPLIFQKSNLKQISKSLRADKNLLKSCNCPVQLPKSQEKKRLRKLVDPSKNKLYNLGSPPARRNVEMDEFLAVAEIPSSSSPKRMTYRLIASKQMVGIFLTVWTRKDLVPHIGHLRFSSVGRGIMGYLGNKGCISISMTLHKTTFCFVCSHLASGEKEGDELKRNADVAEILKSTQFSKICKTRPCQRAPEKIIDHGRIIWLGDLNYRMALSYEETIILLDDNNWDTLLQKDQLNLERGAGRVFIGFNEGRILFAPTYKYSQNSDSYAGETVKSKKKRRTPAWCDRILWRGEGIEQLSYVRGESRFSDHRPVCAVFAVEVEVRKRNNRFRKGYSCAAPRLLDYDDCIPQRHSLYDF